MRNEKVIKPLYRKIAIDIAKNIVSGRYVEGERLYGRSVLASFYKTSPETIRKAIYILKDVGIVNTEKGSGIKIISLDKAKSFLKRNDNINSIKGIKKEIRNWMQDQIKEHTEILKKIETVIDESERLNTLNPLNPFQIVITDKCKVIGKTISDLHFWHNTGSTIIAIKRDDTLLISPGPYASLNIDDTLFLVGDDAAYSAAMKLLY